VTPHFIADLTPSLKREIRMNYHESIDGEDQSGISKETGWQGGGGFRYCRLTPA